MNFDPIPILTELISFPTLTIDQTICKKGLEYIAGLFDSKFEAKYFEHNGVFSQLIYPKGRDWQNLKILLNGHLDVVPGSPEIFKPRLEGNKIYGRGAADMKGGLAALICGFLEVASEKTDLNCGLLITCDEEVGGKNGAGYLVQEIGLKPEFVLIGDGPRTDRLSITLKEKGGAWIRLQAHGRSAHAARPWLGENALDKIIDAITKIKEFVGEIEENEWKSTYNLARLHTENITHNAVPDNAEAVIDIRFTEALAENPKELLEKIKKLLPGIKVSALTEVALLKTDPEYAEIKLLRDIANTILEQDVPLVFGHGASDGRYFSELGIPVAIIGPIGGGWHAPGEWADVPSLRTLKNITREFIKTSLS